MTVKELFPNKPTKKQIEYLRILAKSGCEGQVFDCNDSCPLRYINGIDCSTHTRNLGLRVPNKDQQDPLAKAILDLYDKSCIQK